MFAVGARRLAVLFFQDLAARFDMPGLPEFMDRAEIMRTYEDLSGHALQDLEWFEVYAALRFAIVSIRTSTRGIAYGSMEQPKDPDDLVMFRALLETRSCYATSEEVAARPGLAERVLELAAEPVRMPPGPNRAQLLELIAA